MSEEDYCWLRYVRENWSRAMYSQAGIVEGGIYKAWLGVPGLYVIEGPIKKALALTSEVEGGDFQIVSSAGRAGVATHVDMVETILEARGG